MTRTLSVWWEGTVVGTLQVNQHGEMRFTYAPGWLADASRPPISFSLPRREQPFEQRQCRPFFAGLLPEESQRDVIAGALGISTGNDFAFLEALGGDVAGALSLWPDGEVPPAPEQAGTPRPLSDDELIELLDTLPKRPLLAGREGLRLSLAGAQAKLPVVLSDDRVALPVPGQPTTTTVASTRADERIGCTRKTSVRRSAFRPSGSMRSKAAPRSRPDSACSAERRRFRPSRCWPSSTLPSST